MAPDDMLDKLNKMDSEIDEKIDSLFRDTDIDDEPQRPEPPPEKDPWEKIKEYFLTIEWQIDDTVISNLSREVKKLLIRQPEGPQATVFGWMNVVLEKLQGGDEQANKETMRIFHQLKNGIFEIMNNPDKDQSKLLDSLRSTVERDLLKEGDQDAGELDDIFEGEEFSYEELDRLVDEAIRPEDDAFAFPEEEKIPAEEEFRLKDEPEVESDIDLETGDSVLAEDLPLEEKFDWDEADGELKEIPDFEDETVPEIPEERMETPDSLGMETTELEEPLIVAEEPEEDAFSWEDETVEPADFDDDSLDKEISWEVPPPVEESTDIFADQAEPADAVDDFREEPEAEDYSFSEEADEEEEIDWGAETAEAPIPDSDLTTPDYDAELSSETDEKRTIPLHEEGPVQLTELEAIKASLEQGEGQLMTILEGFRSSQDPLGFSLFQKQAKDTIERFTQEMEKTLKVIRERIRSLDDLDLVPRREEAVSEEKPLEEVLFFSVSDRIFALPTANVTGIFKVPSQKAYDLIKQKEMVIKDRVVPIRSSWDTLEIQKRTGDFFAGEKRILLMSTRLGETAFVVDDVVGRQSMEMVPADQEDPKCFAGVVKIEKQAYVLNPEAL